MGSSTAYGVGASVYDSSWVGRTSSWLNSNVSDGLDTIVYNISFPGYDTYQEMPTNFVPPPGRPSPDEDFNVTKALSYDPDIVIINLPSNDLNYGYAKKETMSNFRRMFSDIMAADAMCYITTPQPRNDFDAPLRDSLFSMVDSITNAFGVYAVNFWDSLVTTDGQHMLRDDLRATGSPLHLNNRGHEILFQRIKASGIFTSSGPVPLNIISFRAELLNKSVLVKWQLGTHEAGTRFQVERSTDGNFFQTVFSQMAIQSNQSAEFSGIDQYALPGRSFYRLKVIHAGQEFYSNIVSILNKETGPEIIKLYTGSGSSQLNAEISIPKSQSLFFTIINGSGALMSQEKRFIERPSGTISLPIANLSKGQYYLQVKTSDGNTIVRSFIR